MGTVMAFAFATGFGYVTCRRFLGSIILATASTTRSSDVALKEQRAGGDGGEDALAGAGRVLKATAGRRCARRLYAPHPDQLPGLLQFGVMARWGAVLLADHLTVLPALIL